MSGAPQSTPGAPTAGPVPALEPPATPSPRGREGAGWVPVTLPEPAGEPGQSLHPRERCGTGDPYSQSVLGVLRVLVVRRCHPSRESRSNPARETLVRGQGLRLGGSGACRVPTDTAQGSTVTGTSEAKCWP